ARHRESRARSKGRSARIFRRNFVPKSASHGVYDLGVPVVFGTKVSENLSTELRAEDNRHAKIVETVTCCVKVKVPDSLRPVLDALVRKARACVAVCWLVEWNLLANTIRNYRA